LEQQAGLEPACDRFAGCTVTIPDHCYVVGLCLVGCVVGSPTWTRTTIDRLTAGRPAVGRSGNEMVGDRRIELRWRAFTEPAAPRASPGLRRMGRTRLDSNQRGADARPLKRRLPSIAWLLVRYSTIGILEDTVGLAPTLRRLRASRVKSPVRSLLRSRVRNGVCLRCSFLCGSWRCPRHAEGFRSTTFPSIPSCSSRVIGTPGRNRTSV
jgi:hypothetical protein